MVYLLNTILKDNKKCTHALRGSFGLGAHRCKQICDLLGVSRNVRLKSLNSSRLSQLTDTVTQNYYIGTFLKSIVNKRKKRLVSMSCYRGIRLTRGLPLRGQRTHGNGKTSRRLNKVH